jgi:U4/U6 small nuclear ribonucleoprotein PRP31
VWQKVDAALANPGDGEGHGAGPIEEDPEYKLIVASNRIIQDLDDEIVTVHRFVVDLYSKKFPDLEQLVPAKLDYVRTVLRIRNETVRQRLQAVGRPVTDVGLRLTVLVRVLCVVQDMTLVDLTDLLPSATIMVVSVTGSSSSGKPLPADELKECLTGCEEMLALFEARNKILGFVESRMNVIAPNVCAILGSAIAAQLVGQVGGLLSLSRIPGCNIQVVGQEKKSISGFAPGGAPRHTGLIYNCELIQTAPPGLRMKALKVVAAKVAMAARMDCYQQSPSGEGGQKLREEIIWKIDKWQEPQKAPEKKALPVPDDKPRRKRGGKRVRKFQEKFAMTDVRKEANRRSFADTNVEYGDDAMGYDIGMLGASGGKLRLPAAKEKKQPVKQQKVHKASSGATNGLSSSIIFTPTQGLELENPMAAAEKQRKLDELNKKWFDQASGFMSAKPK